MYFLKQAILLSRPFFSILGSSITEESCTLPSPYTSVTGTCIEESTCSGYVTPGLCHGAATIRCCTDTFAPDNGPSTGQLSESGKAFVQSFEGFRKTFYCDKSHQPPAAGPRGPCTRNEGNMAIGWGYDCRAHDCSQIAIPITRTQGDKWFDDIVRDVVHHIKTKLGDTVFDSVGIISQAVVTAAKKVLQLTQNQLDALVDFEYNGGPGRINDIAEFIKSGDYESAFNYMKTIINGGTLRQRRYMEINLFNS